MNKAELINAIAAKTNQPKNQVAEVLDGFVDVLKTGLKAGDKIAITGVLSFEAQDKPAKTGRNPATGAEIKIPARTVVKVKAGKALQDAVA